ncbi:hypothetical protein LTR36_008217 [Oleoguttula mirabilis]|uniref:Uncharacterized protein n=1 Tax=Oleoguttula mirabilis TaxID=1507867 RepID=A0AAV9J8N5_9PEZI|nr:hypothetical protein LTR36_008217 [Oleoguttula mirabilis]
MRSTVALGLLLAFWTSLAYAVEQEHTVDIFAWPLSAPKSQSLAKVTFNSTAATIKTYNEPSIPAGDEIVRVGFYHPSGSWSGIATAASNFAAEKTKKLQLHLNPSGELYHVGFTASTLGTSSKTSNSKDGLSVEVVRMKAGPTPQLNKPVVVNPDGTAPEKEVEKTFFQKYWWAIAGFLVLQVVMSMGKGD